MAINYAGVDMMLEDPSGEVDRFIRRHWRLPNSPINCQPRIISPQTFAQIPNWPEMPVLRLNQLFLPSGATRWSRVLLLTDDAGVNALATTTYGVLNFGLNYPDQMATALTANSINPFYNKTPTVADPSWKMGGNFNLIMFKLDPIPVAWVGDKRLYIVPLVCERFWWQGLNLVTTATSWGTDASVPVSGGPTLFNDIATALLQNALGSPSVTDYIGGDLTPIGQPSCQAFLSGPIPAAAALDLMCWSQNVMLVPDINTYKSDNTTLNLTEVTTGKFIQRYRVIGEGNATGPKSTKVWYGQEYYANCPPIRIQSQLSPQTVAGYDRFGKNAHDHPASVNMTFTNQSDFTQVQYSKNIAAPVGEAGLIGRGQMWVRGLAGAKPGATPTSMPSNITDLDTIATQWVTRWYAQNAIAFEWVFNQMPVLKFCGVEDYVMMDMARKGGTSSGNTRWISLPGHFGYEYVAIGSADDACGQCNGGLFLFKLFSVDCVNQTAMGTPVRPPKGGTLPTTAQHIVDGLDEWDVPYSLSGWLSSGDPALIDGQYAWCQEIDPDPYSPGVRLWVIIIMSGLDSICG